MSSSYYMALLAVQSTRQYRDDTLAYRAYADARGYQHYDLARIDAVHAALAAAGLASGAQPGMHYSSEAFGVLVTDGQAEEVGCLFRNPLVATAPGSGPGFVPGGWRGRNQLAYSGSSMRVMGLAQGTGQSTVAVIGNPGTPPSSGFAAIAELSNDFNSSSAWLLGIESQLYYAARSPSYNLVSENTNYVAGDRYLVGRSNAANTAGVNGTAVRLAANHVAQSGRLYNVAGELSGAYAANIVYVGARGGQSYYLQNATINGLFIANQELSDAQLACVNTLADSYAL